MPELDELQSQLDEEVKTQEEAAARAEKLRDQMDDVRVESFNKAIVDEANELSINPRNFATEDELTAAINQTKQERPPKEDEEEDQNGEA